MEHILRSDYRIINGIFMAVAYHVDLSIHNMVFDDDRLVALTKLGPFVNSIREHKAEDEYLAQTFGTEIVDALKEFAKAKEKV